MTEEFEGKATQYGCNIT